MSRVHDALRKAEQMARASEPVKPEALEPDSPAEAASVQSPVAHVAPTQVGSPAPIEPAADSSFAVAQNEPVGVSAVALADPEPEVAATPAPAAVIAPPPPMSPVPQSLAALSNGHAPALHLGAAVLTDAEELDVEGLLSRIQEIPFTPSPDAHLIDASRPHEAPTEEFRTLRTRLNHLQSLQPLHTVVVSSPSPAEGKSMAAVNLALAESHLAGNLTLLADFDFRRPIVHQLFQMDRSPGITDFLLGKAKLEEVIRKIAGTNLYVMPAGEAVINPLELLNLPSVKSLLKTMPKVFNWMVLDSPPLLFAADAALLGTMSDGTVLVVRIGRTTVDSVTRAMNSLCENNILGIIVNGARRGELYSKYTYYHSYYYTKPD